MPQTDTRSLQQIKRETEQTRAGLTDTVEQLKTSVADTASDIRRRISPDAIKAEVSDYIKSRGEQLVNDVTAAARKNPMQAVAVGASLAYPLFRLARSIPVPVLMVGAGLFLAGSKSGQAATQKASDIASDLSEDLVQRAQELGDQVGDSAIAAKAYASDQIDRVSAAVSGVTGSAGQQTRQVGLSPRLPEPFRIGLPLSVARLRVARANSRTIALEWPLLPRPPYRIPLHPWAGQWQAGPVTLRNKLCEWQVPPVIPCRISRPVQPLPPAMRPARLRMQEGRRPRRRTTGHLISPTALEKPSFRPLNRILWW